MNRPEKQVTQGRMVLPVADQAAEHRTAQKGESAGWRRQHESGCRRRAEGAAVDRNFSYPARQPRFLVDHAVV